MKREDLKSGFVTCMKEFGKSSTFYWKRFLRNIESDTVCLDIDAIIWNIDLNNEETDDKYLEMFKELEKVIGGELIWEKSIQALQSIGVNDLAIGLKWILVHDEGKTVKILVSENTFACDHAR